MNKAMLEAAAHIREANEAEQQAQQQLQLKAYYLTDSQAALVCSLADNEEEDMREFMKDDGDEGGENSAYLSKIIELKATMFRQATAQGATPAVEPAIDDPRFTDKDRKQIHSCIVDEMGDLGLHEMARDQMQKEDLIELISYADDDPEATGEMLEAMEGGSCDVDDLKSGEFEEHEKLITFAIRMGLVNGGDQRVTDLGRKYIQRHS